MTRSLLAGFVVLLLTACASTQNRAPEATGEFGEAPRFLREEIQERVASLAYQSESQLYDNLIRLTYIGEPAIPYLLVGLKADTARTRSSCAYVLGLLRDRRTIAPLRAALTDKVPEVRYEVATALCSMGVRDGYPVLIEGLSDPEIRNRYKAHEALKLLTRLDFGYQHDAAPTERAKAIHQWEAWWDRLKEQP